MFGGMLNLDLPMVFAGLLALSVLIYAVLDGFDLGVGIMLPLNNSDQADHMIASIGPFWDANETWLVLAVGILLVAFPTAHSLIMQQLYLPVFIMLIGLILRGVAFDFRAKAIVTSRVLWNRLFKFGSCLTALAQGFMLGFYVMGFASSFTAYAFALLSALCVTAAYAFIGGAWLIMKSEGELQARAAHWTRIACWLTGVGILAVSLVNISINPDIMVRWFGGVQALLLLPIPMVCLALLVVVDRYSVSVPRHGDFGCWIPFAAAATIFFFTFCGMVFSYYPYVVPGVLTFNEAASSVQSLEFMLYGVLFVIPAVLSYTIFSYRVFWGKSRALSYS